MKALAEGLGLLGFAHKHALKQTQIYTLAKLPHIHVDIIIQMSTEMQK